MLLKQIRRGQRGRSRVVQFIQLLPKQESCRVSLILLFMLVYASLSLSGTIFECRWSACTTCSLSVLLQVVQMVVKLYLSSHHLCVFWVIDKWSFYCGPSATDTKIFQELDHFSGDIMPALSPR